MGPPDSERTRLSGSAHFVTRSMPLCPKGRGASRPCWTVVQQAEMSVFNERPRHCDCWKVQFAARASARQGNPERCQGSAPSFAEPRIALRTLGAMRASPPADWKSTGTVAFRILLAFVVLSVAMGCVQPPAWAADGPAAKP